MELSTGFMHPLNIGVSLGLIYIVIVFKQTNIQGMHESCAIMKKCARPLPITVVGNNNMQ